MNETSVNPEFDWQHPSNNLTAEQMDEIMAARHAWSYPGITAIRQRIRENYSTRDGVHYAGAEADADRLLEIVDALYAQRERTKAQIELHILEYDKRLESYRKMVSEQGEEPGATHWIIEHQEFREGLARALKHLNDTPEKAI